MLSVVGNGLLRQVSKFFLMFMSTPMRWKNDYFLCKYLIIFHLYIIWNAQVKSGNCYFALFIGNMKTKCNEDQQVNFRDDTMLYNLSAIFGKLKWTHFVN